MKEYASKTTVSVEDSRAELDTLLGKHGATQRIIGHDEEMGQAGIAFTIAGATYRMRVPMPRMFGVKDKPDNFNSWQRDRKEEWIAQTSRARWRSLLLLVKARLEAVRLGISTVEREFLADRLLSDGLTVEQKLSRHIDMPAPQLLASNG